MVTRSRKSPFRTSRVYKAICLRNSEWDVATSWRLRVYVAVTRGLCGCYGVYIPIFFAKNRIDWILTGRFAWRCDRGIATCRQGRILDSFSILSAVYWRIQTAWPPFHLTFKEWLRQYLHEKCMYLRVGVVIPGCNHWDWTCSYTKWTLLIWKLTWNCASNWSYRGDDFSMLIPPETGAARVRGSESLISQTQLGFRLSNNFVLFIIFDDWCDVWFPWLPRKEWVENLSQDEEP